MKKDKDNIKEKFWAIILKSHSVDEEKYRPILQKISKTTSYLYLWRTKEEAYKFLDKNKIPKDNSEIVDSNNKIIAKTIKDFEGHIKIETKIIE